jgi:hypothetical protein
VQHALVGILSGLLYPSICAAVLKHHRKHSTKTNDKTHKVLLHNIYDIISCRTVALWFYISASDHNATDPVIQKVAIYGADFFAHFGNVYLYFPTLIKKISFVTSI